MEAGAQRSLIANAGGNPLYAEEFARMLEERGETTDRLPESVQGIIAARLDGLEASDKALVQDAAVLGKVFWIGALAAVSGEQPFALEQRLHELERRELIRRDRTSAVADERQYAFRHVLVRDVAYGQIPRGQRAAKHAAVAGWIERLSSDRTDDRSEMLAHHWSSALSYVPAGGEMATEFGARARTALIEAGDRALGLNAAAAAVALYGQAIGLTDGEPPADLLLRHGRSLYLAGDEGAAEVLGRARDALAAAGDVSGEAYAEAMLSHVEWSAGDADASTRRVARAVALVESQPASEMKARVIARAASRAMVANRNEEAVRLGREAYALAEELGLADLRVNTLSSVGSARMGLGDREGLHDLERALELGLTTNTPEAARTAINLGVSHFLLGDIARYAQLHADSLGISERFGERPLIRFAQGSQSSLDYFMGDWDAALGSADAFIAECEAVPHYQEPHARAIRGAIRFARDDVEGALDDIERALAGATDPQSQGPPYSIGSRVFCELGDPRAVATSLHTLDISFGTTPEPLSSALLSVTPVPPEVEARLREVVGGYPAGASRWVDGAQAALAGRFLEAAEIYASMPVRPAEADARVRAAEILIGEGRTAQAEEQLGLALDFWHSVGAVRYLRAVERVRERIVA
jgi:tetratricopeptide (TPR) repeat protein